jgi:chemotaxis protein MotB
MDVQKMLQDDKKRFEAAKSEIEHTVKTDPKFRELAKSTQVRISHEGLRIDLMESALEVFFDSGSATPKPRTRDLLVKIAGTLGKLPNRIVIEGHTDSRPYCGPNGWTNWELSTARANAARTIMEHAGVRAGQLLEVRGLADRMLLDPLHPASFKNRRVSILLPFSVTGPSEVLKVTPDAIKD